MTELEALKIAIDKINSSEDGCESHNTAAILKLGEMADSFEAGSILCNKWRTKIPHEEYLCPVCGYISKCLYDKCPNCNTVMTEVC